MMEIIEELDIGMQRRLLRQWARSKSKEASYIQVAGGFIFTTVASCLQWPSTQEGHWSAAASFYVCMLLALVAIVTGSQQMLVLPQERLPDSDEDPDKGSESSAASKSKDRYNKGLKEEDEQHLQAVLKRLRDTSRNHRPNAVLVFALQTPMMLLAGSVVTFLAGICSVVFAPLAIQPVWSDKAKIAVGFSAAGGFCIIVFATASFLIHSLFSSQPGHESKMRWLVADL
ncbi:MAG: hypothetical protein Q9182_007628 [Xanthomendoza sp. 2 TL-2023]